MDTQSLSGCIAGSPCRCKRDVPESDVSGLTTLQIDRSAKPFAAVQSATCDARNLLFVNNGLTVLHNGDHASNQHDVVGLPFSWSAPLLRRGSQEAIDASSTHRRPFGLGIVFNLKFVPAAQVDAAIRSWRAIEFNV